MKGLVWLVSLFTLVCACPALAQTVEYSNVDLATVRVFALHGVDAVEVQGDRPGSKLKIAVADAGHGTGVLIEREGVIATAQHVVKGAKLVAVKKPGDKRAYLAEVVRSSRKRDVALLVIAGEHQNTIPLPQELPKLKARQTVFAMGYPWDSTRIEPQSSRGVVAGLTADNWLQLSMAINPGNSGGPVVDENDALLGLVSKGADPKKGAQGIALAAPVSSVIELRKKLSSKRLAEARARVSRAAKTDEPLAELVVRFTQQGSLLRDIVRAMDAGKIGKLRKLVRLVQHDEASADARVLAGAYYWNESVARYATGEKNWAPLQRHSAKVCAEALERDPELPKRAPFLSVVLNREQLRRAKARVKSAHSNENLQSAEGVPLAKAPGALGGFVLGSTSDKARASCEGEGHEFKAVDATHFTCSGTAREVALDGWVELSTCNERICRVTLLTRPSLVDSERWSDTFRALQGRYQALYGDARHDISKMPGKCQRELLPCLKNGHAALSYSWNWPERRQSLAMGRHGGKPVIRIRLESTKR